MFVNAFPSIILFIHKKLKIYLKIFKYLSELSDFAALYRARSLGRVDEFGSVSGGSDVPPHPCGLYEGAVRAAWARNLD
jgi:hypothetical protein